MKYLQVAAPFLLVVAIIIFFKPFFLSGRIPIPADTIIGLFHPYRDLYAPQYPNGIPYKNALITDPVEQQYPWKNLATSALSRGEMPLWNPYSLAGTPLLANFQSAPFYPLNSVFFWLSFPLAWGTFIFLQPLLASLFMYFYLKYLKIDSLAAFFSAITISFSGFFVAWMEWGNIAHTVLWLPLVLLAIEHVLTKRSWLWNFILIFSTSSMLLAGHLQTFFYAFVLCNIYLISRIIQQATVKKKIDMSKTFKKCLPFFASWVAVFMLTIPFWLPTLQFISLSAREVDQSWGGAGWFVPWQNLIQFIAPDFFGNPATLNYWGVWNYGEFVGYIGIAPLIFALYAILFRQDKKTYFFSLVTLIALLFAVPSGISSIPYLLHLPFISTAMPTRLLFVVDFSLIILTALGFDLFIRQRKRIYFPILIVLCFFVVAWLFVLLQVDKLIPLENYQVAKRNLIFPTVLFIAVSSVVFASAYNKIKKIQNALLIIIIVISIFDLFRFADKFLPFTDQKYLYPQTKIISFLQKNVGISRIMATSREILPPNFSVMYKIQSIEGYDPLYLKRYGELLSASERKRPDIAPPFGFSRIITPHNYDSKIIDLLGVKYILSFDEINSPKLTKVMTEGKTKVYENKNALPRAFFVEDVVWVNNKQEAINLLFKENFDAKKTAIVEKRSFIKGAQYPTKSSIGKVKIISYSENRIILETETTSDAFLVFTDSYYPTWHLKIYNTDPSRYTIDPRKIGNSPIETVDYNFRGTFLSKGKYRVEMYNSLFPDIIDD